MRRRAFEILVSLLERWLKPTILDAAGVAACDQLRCYALAERSLLDLAAVEIACRREQLPSPVSTLGAAGLEACSGHFALIRSEGRLLRRRSARRRSAVMGRILEASRAGERIAVIPVSIFWGRAPHRENSTLRLLLSERWTATGTLRRLLGILFNRSHLFVRFGAPIALDELLEEVPAPVVEQRRLARLLRTRFRRAREALIGPDLSHRRTLLRRVLSSRNVTEAIREHAARENVSVRKAARRAQRNAREIASDLSYPVIRFFDVLLSWLWNRLYDGVEVNGIDPVQAIAEDHTIIYTPSHRSHVDYLLMSYVLFYQGLMLPHVAAGRNLNIPVVGPLLRRAGAFFMRRSFRGDPLYSAVFEAYLDRMYAEGFSVEYFIEGGRSRTGRLLPPRGGMLRMTLRSFLREPSRPLAFVPVYFGYEKVIEARTYMGELQGRSKQSESLGTVLRSIRFLRQSFGRVQVNFGEPIVLREFLDARVPGWEAQREAALAGEAEWLAPAVTDLGERLQQGVNAAAAVNPVGLLATVLLSTRRQALDEPTLEDRIAILLRLIREAPVSADVTVTDLSAPEVIAYCEGHGVLQREAHPLGDILALGELDRVLLTWYRNNIVHLFALPSLLAALLASGEVRSRARLQTNCARVLPYLRSELFLRLDDADLGDELDRLLGLLADMDLIRGTVDGFSVPPPETTGHARLHQLAALLMPTLERYYIAIALIDTHASGQLNTGGLVDACVLTAQRMARLHGLDAPEFFDATLFQRFVDELVEQDAVTRDADGFLHHGNDLHPVLIEASRVLDPDFCQGVIAARRLPELLPMKPAKR